MCMHEDSAGNKILNYDDLSWILIGNSHDTRFFAADQELWEYVGIDPATALSIAQGFPEHWCKVPPQDAADERADSYRRSALPQLAKASIPLPPLSTLTTEEQRPTFDLLARYNMIKPGPFDVEAEYARYPFVLLNELYPPGSPQLPYEQWHALLQDLFRLLFRSGHGLVRPEAITERFPKRWIIYNDPLWLRFRAVTTSAPSTERITSWNKMVRWLKDHLTSKRSG
jgi:hypothetical protein